MAEPEKVVDEDQDYVSCQFEAFGLGARVGQLAAGKNEDWISQFNNGKVAQVPHVDPMADDADEGEEKGEAVDQSQEDLDDDDGVDEAREELAGEDGVLLYQFGEVIKSTCYG